MSALCLLAAAALLTSCGSPAATGTRSGSGHTSTTLGPVAAAGIPYDLPIHCGVRYAIFDEASWVADEPVPTIPTDLTDPVSGIGSNRYAIHGTMSRLGATTAMFTSSEDPVGVSVKFTLWNGAIPGCA